MKTPKHIFANFLDKKKNFMLKKSMKDIVYRNTVIDFANGMPPVTFFFYSVFLSYDNL